MLVLWFVLLDYFLTGLCKVYSVRDGPSKSVDHQACFESRCTAPSNLQNHLLGELKRFCKSQHKELDMQA